MLRAVNETIKNLSGLLHLREELEAPKQLMAEEEETVNALFREIVKWVEFEPEDGDEEQG